ncbi:MAG: PmoA family protein [Vicinamibacterales bacterium]
MMRRFLTIPAVAAFVYVGLQSAVGTSAIQPQAGVSIRHDAAAGEYAVTVAGKTFTGYQYGKDFREKPAFYPVVAPNGARVNREYPMVPNVAGETTDHPHHQSMFFAYDEVNGTNFWNPEATARHIEHLRATVAGSTLTADLAWKDKDNAVVLTETKRVTFGGGGDVFWMDHDITLTAPRVAVSMGDTKEGAFAIRLNDTLKENGGSGRYINAEGLETAANVWGKTSAWVAIRGTVKEAAATKNVTVAIFAHKAGLNFPPYWHARDYGLFAANPFGRKSYDPAAPQRITRLAVGESARVRFRLAVYDGQVSKARLDQDYAALP